MLKEKGAAHKRLRQKQRKERRKHAVPDAQQRIPTALAENLLTSKLASQAIFLQRTEAMKLVGWLRFTWESRLLPSTSYIITEQYSIRRAAKQEKTQAWQVISSCFLLDTCWNDVVNDLLRRIHHDFDEKFSHREIDCLVITHGNRIIGASVVQPLPEVANHLLSGPCVSNEYRNRGFGALLLKESLLIVAKHGLPKVFGITRSTSPAAKFVYPKFGGKSENYELPMSDVALAR